VRDDGAQSALLEALALQAHRVHVHVLHACVCRIAAAVGQCRHLTPDARAVVAKARRIIADPSLAVPATVAAAAPAAAAVAVPAPSAANVETLHVVAGPALAVPAPVAAAAAVAATSATHAKPVHAVEGLQLAVPTPVAAAVAVPAPLGTNANPLQIVARTAPAHASAASIGGPSPVSSAALLVFTPPAMSRPIISAASPLPLLSRPPFFALSPGVPASPSAARAAYTKQKRGKRGGQQMKLVKTSV